jgi:hypothetical protein
MNPWWREDLTMPEPPNRDRDNEEPEEFTETPAGYRARERWARRYDDLNGAPESDYDR